jgi:hypothetical protein
VLRDEKFSQRTLECRLDFIAAFALCDLVVRLTGVGQIGRRLSELLHLLTFYSMLSSNAISGYLGYELGTPTPPAPHMPLTDASTANGIVRRHSVAIQRGKVVPPDAT